MELDDIGPYELLHTLGSGGMGTVYLARHRESGEQVALKVLAAEMSRDKAFRERFRREIAALEMLRNKHVVQLLDSSGDDDERLYYAMDYVEGENLADRLKRVRRIPWKEVIDISVQICVALKAAHDAGVVHRDVKPSNLMITKDGLVKLTDFGVARLFAARQITLPDTIIGTAEYMSPEQACGQQADKRSDLYSLGAVIYAMLTGRPPFVAKATAAVIRMHQTHQFDVPSRYVELPSWLEEIVCKLLEKSPEDRYPNAFVVSRQLQTVIPKVELSQSDDTVVSQSRVGSNDATLAGDDVSELEPTVAGTSAGGDVSYIGGPGEATLVRDLVRMEVEKTHGKSVIGKAFNNVWVLLLCLAGLIYAVVYGIQNTNTDETTESTSATWQSEVRRTIDRANHLHTIGQTEIALAELEAISKLLPEKGSAILRSRLRSRIDHLGQQLESKRKLLQSRLDEADVLAADDDEAAAREIWEQIVVRYTSEPDVAALVKVARTQLESDRNQE